MTRLQTEVFVASMLYWIAVTLLLVWITRSIRNIKANLKDIERRVEAQNED